MSGAAPSSHLVGNAAAGDVDGRRGHGASQVRGGEGGHIADILERLYPLEHARVNEAFGDGLAPVLAGRLGHAAALQGHDADAMRPKLHGQLTAQDVDRAHGDLETAEVDLETAAGVVANGVTAARATEREDHP